MTHQEILEKAISKAIAGGWQPSTVDLEEDGWWKWDGMHLCAAADDDSQRNGWHYAVIFNHQFAKALWGEPKLKDSTDENLGWQHHLQMMVIADDAIEYLGKNL